VSKAVAKDRYSGRSRPFMYAMERVTSRPEDPLIRRRTRQPRINTASGVIEFSCPQE